MDILHLLLAFEQGPMASCGGLRATATIWQATSYAKTGPAPAKEILDQRTSAASGWPCITCPPVWGGGGRFAEIVREMTSKIMSGAKPHQDGNGNGRKAPSAEVTT